jgi:hypothetical protein
MSLKEPEQEACCCRAADERECFRIRYEMEWDDDSRDECCCACHADIRQRLEDEPRDES